jgi:hypothetical protein
MPSEAVNWLAAYAADAGPLRVGAFSIWRWRRSEGGRQTALAMLPSCHIQPLGAPLRAANARANRSVRIGCARQCESIASRGVGGMNGRLRARATTAGGKMASKPLQLRQRLPISFHLFFLPLGHDDCLSEDGRVPGRCEIFVTWHERLNLGRSRKSDRGLVASMGTDRSSRGTSVSIFPNLKRCAWMPCRHGRKARGLQTLPPQYLSRDGYYLDVRYWHKADIAMAMADVRFWR